MENIKDFKRTDMCGELTAADDGKDVVLMGWVQRRRDLGALIFVTLRDRTGIIQIVFNSDTDPELHDKALGVRSEYVLAVKGTLKRRSPDAVNKNMPTGEVEVIASELRILGKAKLLPSYRRKL